MLILIRQVVWTVVIPTFLIVLSGIACVQRNVEPISSEEAASISPPPEPLASSQQTDPNALAVTRLSGVVEVAPDLAGEVPENATLYLIVRVAGREGGAPLAVQQIRSPSFPLAFVITESDAMIEGTPLIGEMSVTARVDQDGDAFTTTAGDVVGQTSPVVAGDNGIVVQLNERLSGAPGP